MPASIPLDYKTLAEGPGLSKTANAVAAGTEVTVWTPAPGKKFVVTSAILAASAACNLTLRDNTAGTILAVVPLPVNTAQTVQLSFLPALVSATANNVLTMTSSVASNISGTFYGMET